MRKSLTLAIENFISNKQWNDSFNLSNLAIDLYKENELFYLYKVQSLIELKKYDEAEKIIEKLINSNLILKKSWKLYYFSAVAKTRVSTHKDAQEKWKLAFLKYPNNFSIALGYAKSLLEDDKNELALSLFSKLIEKGFKHSALYEGVSKSIVRIVGTIDDKVLHYLLEAVNLSKNNFSKNLHRFEYVNLHRFLYPDRYQSLLKELCIDNKRPEIYSYIVDSHINKIETSNYLSAPHDHSYVESGVKALYSNISAALEAKIPLSLIRLGDGEAQVMSGKLRNLLGAAGTISKKSLDLDDNEHQKFMDVFNDALCNADYLGMPSAQLMLTQDNWCDCYRYLPDLVKMKLFKEIVVIDWCSHYHLYWSGILKKLLMGRDFCGYISCHDLSESLMAYGVKKTHGYHIPGEHMYKLNLREEPHYPFYYEKILSEIDVPKGGLFLVGAGLLGKIYCNEIKRRDGVALDLGAVLDNIVGIKYTRHTIGKPVNRGFNKLANNISITD